METRRVLIDRRKRQGLSLALYGLERRSLADRRVSPRMSLEIGCEGTAEDGSWFFRMSSDLSITGVSLGRGLPYAPGTRVSLKLQLPDDGEPLVVDAEVVGRFGPEGGMRLAFVEIPADKAVRIANALLLCADVATRLT